MDLTVASTTAITPARLPVRAAAPTATPTAASGTAPSSAGAGASASSPGRQLASDVIDLRSGATAAGSGILLRVTVGGSTRTYTYNSFSGD